MNKTQLMRALQNYNLAERQAGPNASKDDIHKFYLNASLANHVGKYCSLEFFEFLTLTEICCLRPSHSSL